MRKIIASFLVMAIITGTMTSCKATTRYEGQFLQLFDTVSTIVAYMDTKAGFTRFSTMIHDTLNEYHRLYDIYHDYEGVNNIKTINDNAGKKPVMVDRKIIDLMLFSKEAYERTNGKCNIALGSVLKIWHKYREEGIDDPEHAKLPAMSELQEAAKHTDINKIIVDEKNSTVYLDDPDMSIDVGAVAKGYSTEQAAGKAAGLGYTSALLSIGGNVRAIGGKTGEKNFWNIGIQNPDKSSTDLLVTRIKDKSVVTSGIYERYYTVNGKNYHHIIDPDTLMPAAYFKAVTIICGDSGIADELSTAIFCMPYEQGVEIIRRLPDTEALWVMPDGSLKYSESFKRYIKS